MSDPGRGGRAVAASNEVLEQGRGGESGPGTVEERARPGRMRGAVRVPGVTGDGMPGLCLACLRVFKREHGRRLGF